MSLQPIEMLPQLLKRNAPSMSHVVGLSALAVTDRLEVDAPASVDWTLDGEKAEGTEHYVIENLHHAVNVITNLK